MEPDSPEWEAQRAINMIAAKISLVKSIIERRAALADLDPDIRARVEPVLKMLWEQKMHKSERSV